jgi:hypothetical protein
MSDKMLMGVVPVVFFVETNFAFGLGWNLINAADR